MESLTTLFVFLIVFLISIILFSGRGKRHTNLPPGPRLYPFVGNLLQVANKDLRQVFREYSQTYGPIFSVTIFGKIIIVVSGYEILKDVFAKHGAIFSDRPDSSNIGGMSPLWKGSGIVFASGEIWKHNTRFVLHTLKDFGMGKRLMQTKIHEEISHVLNILDKHNGTPFDIKSLIQMAVSNVILSVMFGKRFSYHDDEFLSHLECVDEIVKLRFYVPSWLRFIPGDPFCIKKQYQCQKQLIAFCIAEFRKHLESFDKSNTRDLIDAYIKEMKQERNANIFSLKNEDELVRILNDLFVAGTETTTTVLRFSLIYLVRNPDVQAKIHTELQDVIPNDRTIEMDDRKHLPYTAATILEIQRLSSIVPHSLPHAVKTDTHYGGYTIPEKALILPNLESVAMDEASWDSPFCFDPSRFLDNNASLIRSEDILPFSLGPRVCAGEAMANMEIFLFLTAMIRRFNFVLQEGQEVPSYSGKYVGGIVVAGDFKIRAVKRENESVQ